MRALTAYAAPQHIIKKGERLLPRLLFYLDLVHQNKLTQGPRSCKGKWEQPPLLPSSGPTGALGQLVLMH